MPLGAFVIPRGTPGTFVFTYNRYILLGRGVLTSLLGLALLFLSSPSMIVPALALLGGVSAFATGTYLIAAGFRIIGKGWATRSIWPLFVQGLVGMLGGVPAIIYLKTTSIPILYLMASWIFIMGLWEIAMVLVLQL